jgi:hypothetical protein
MSLHINWKPRMEERVRKLWEVRWCFKCRERLPQFAVLYAPVEPDYYGPHWSVECDGCGEDHVHFPGCHPDGPTLEMAE